jgi:hypothetical protein
VSLAQRVAALERRYAPSPAPPYLDPVALARRIGIEPDDWQREVLCATERQLLLNCSRQSGKSTTTGVLAAHTALYEPKSLSLLVSPSERQSIELLRKVKDILAAFGVRSGELEADNTLGIETTSGARVLALPGQESTIRTYSGVRLIAIDEASRAADALYFALRPMLAVSGGRLVLLSTPFGKRGFFHEAWAEGGAAWRRFEIPATLCPRITAEFLAEERRNMPRDIFDQEYGCRFVEGSGSVFDEDDLAAMFGDEVAEETPDEEYLTI